MVGFLKLYDAAQLGFVEHVEHVAAVSHLHGWGVGILVACHYFHTIALQLESHFLA